MWLKKQKSPEEKKKKKNPQQSKTSRCAAVKNNLLSNVQRSADFFKMLQPYNFTIS